MKKQHEPITDAELEVLKQLWKGEPLTARAITESIYGDPSTSNIGTVQKLIQRLEKKGYVQRNRQRHTHEFIAKVPQATVVFSQFDRLANRLCDGQLAPFITHLVENSRLSEKEREEIRRLLED